MSTRDATTVREALRRYHVANGFSGDAMTAETIQVRVARRRAAGARGDRRAMKVLLVLALLSSACVEERASAPDEREDQREEEPDGAEREAGEDAVRLGVPAQNIHRARREAIGLDRMPQSLRRQALERGRERGSPPYAELRRDPSAHENARVSYEGEVGLARPAGERLWIVALRTRQDGERWTDPLYVLCVVPPSVAEHARARVDGWVVGERTIGRHALPLVVAFAIEPAQ